MREILDNLKNGFQIAIEELILFIAKIVGCLYLGVLPLAIVSIVPLLILAFDFEARFLVFKILFSLFQFIALSFSMVAIESEEYLPGNDPGKRFTPSKDLMIAVYVAINIYVWAFM